MWILGKEKGLNTYPVCKGVAPQSPVDSALAMAMYMYRHQQATGMGSALGIGVRAFMAILGVLSPEDPCGLAGLQGLGEED